MAVANIARFAVNVGFTGITALIRGSRLATSAIGGLTSAFGLLLGLVTRLTAAFALLNGAFAGIILINAQMIDRIGKLNKVIGVSTDTIQKFAFAGEQTGITFDQSTIALRRFARRLGEAQRNTGELLPALRRLGISVRDNDGKFKLAEDVLFEFADGLANTKSETAKLALAFKAFDSEGAELVATLEKGSGELRKMFAEAEALGFVLDEQLIANTEKFNDSFNVLVNIVKGAVRTFVGSLAPALNQINKDLAELIKQITDGNGTFKDLGVFLKDKFIDYIISVTEAIGILYQGFVKVFNIAANFINQLDFLQSDTVKELTASLEELDGISATLNRGNNFGTYVSGMQGQLVKLARTLKEAGVPLGELEKFTELGFFDNIALQMGFGIEEFMKGKEALEALARAYIELNSVPKIPLIPDPGEEPFQKFKDYLLMLKGLSQEMVEDLADTASDMEEVVVTGQNKIGETLLGKIFGVERVEEFWDQWYKTGAGSIGKLGAIAELVLGEQIFENLREGLQAAGVTDFVRTLSDGLTKAAVMFEDALADAVVSGKADFDDLAKHLKTVLAKALIQKFFTGPLFALFGLAKGGPAKAGQPYIVGEEGPELFVPRQSGTVVPNHKLGNMSGGPGMGGGAVQNVYINAVDTQSFKTALARQDPEFIFALTQAGARRLPA